MIELKFVNSDARPKVVTVRCDTASMAAIMAWYGAFYAGDRYAVYADGEKLPKDRNGELIAPRDSGSDRNGGDPLGAPGVASQNGARSAIAPNHSFISE